MQPMVTVKAFQAVGNAWGSVAFRKIPHLFERLFTRDD